MLLSDSLAHLPPEVLSKNFGVGEESLAKLPKQELFIFQTDVPGQLEVDQKAAAAAGISMGFAEAASDDGSLSGRGKPLLRGIVCGLMTAAGGIGHMLPFLLTSFGTATAIAVAVVAIELLLISWIRNRFMDTPFLRAAFQVIVGGVLVFLVGIWIGSS